MCSTGHSLGGALCTLFAAETKVRYPEIGCVLYNFGSPKVGDDEFVRRFETPGLPVVLTGLVDAWPAAHGWSFDALLSVLPSCRAQEPSAT